MISSKKDAADSPQNIIQSKANFLVPASIYGLPRSKDNIDVAVFPTSFSTGSVFFWNNGWVLKQSLILLW
jgi:hypothetical protein